MCVPTPLSYYATKDGKCQECQCAIGNGGSRQQQLQGVNVIASWQRAQARHITGVCVPLPLAISRMAEAVKDNEQQVQWAAATEIRWRAQPWHTTGVWVPPPLEYLRMAEATTADVLSDCRTSTNTSCNGSRATATARWPQWNPHGDSIINSKQQSNIPSFARCKETVATALTLIAGVCWEMSGPG